MSATMMKAELVFYAILIGMRYRQSRNKVVRRIGFLGVTLTEILIVIVIIATILAILLPAIAHSRERGRQTACAENLHQISGALLMYTSDSDGIYPPATTEQFSRKGYSRGNGTTWDLLLLPYLNVKTGGFPVCPDRTVPVVTSTKLAAGNPTGYAYNMNLSYGIGYRKLNTSLAQGGSPRALVGNAETLIGFPALVVAVEEARVGMLAADKPDSLENADTILFLAAAGYSDAVIAAEEPGVLRHNGGANYLFVDGHSRWLIPATILTARKCDGTHPGMGI